MRKIKILIPILILVLLSSCGTKNASSPELSPSPQATLTASPNPDIAATFAPAETSKEANAPVSPPPQTSASAGVQTASPLATIAPTPIKSSITLSIYALDKYVFNSAELEFKDGDSVFDILKKVTRNNKIQMEFSGPSSNAYINGINNLYEFDFGPESGWLYIVNGEIKSESCSSYKVKQGDVIEWKYTKNMGKDLGASF